MAETIQADAGDSLRQLGAQVDAGSDPVITPTSEETDPQPVTAEPSKPDAPTEEKSQPPTDGDNAKPESAEPTAEKPPEKPESPYLKAKREGKEREAAAWQKIEAEKATIKAEKEALEKAKSAPKQYRADEYLTAAENAEKLAKEAEAYDPDEAAKHAENAKTFRAEAIRVRQQELVQGWQKQYEQVASEHKILDALKDQSSEPHKQFKAILDSAPHVLFGAPEGAKLAVQLFVSQREAAAVPALKEKLEALTKENERLVKLTSVPRSGPTKTASDPGENQLTERNLRRMAAELDAATPA